MYIKKIGRRFGNRKDIYCCFRCEFCGNEQYGAGYDDEYYFSQVVPEIKCSNCGRSSRRKISNIEPQILLNHLYDVILQACTTPEDEIKSNSITVYADALRLLASYGKLEIIKDNGCRVIAKVKEVENEM